MTPSQESSLVNKYIKARLKTVISVVRRYNVNEIGQGIVSYNCHSKPVGSIEFPFPRGNHKYFQEMQCALFCNVRLHVFN